MLCSLRGRKIIGRVAPVRRTFAKVLVASKRDLTAWTEKTKSSGTISKPLTAEYRLFGFFLSEPSSADSRGSAAAQQEICRRGGGGGVLDSVSFQDVHRLAISGRQRVGRTAFSLRQATTCTPRVRPPDGGRHVDNNCWELVRRTTSASATLPDHW